MSKIDEVQQLRAELRQDWEFIRLNYEKNRTTTDRIAADPKADEFDFAALGYTLHNLYNAFESHFFRIAKFFENRLDEPERHRSLLHRMTLSIEGVRPELLTSGTAQRLEELMRFRHVFRNIYKSPLIPEKVLFANRQADGLIEELETCHRQFDFFLVDLVKRMSEPEQ